MDSHYAHGVEELLIVDPATREVHWFERRQGVAGFVKALGSTLLDLTSAALPATIDWPATG